VLTEQAAVPTATTTTTPAVLATRNEDVKTITLSYYVFGLIAMFSCFLGAMFSWVCCKFCGRKPSDD
jgi:hypothetical protein